MNEKKRARTWAVATLVAVVAAVLGILSLTLIGFETGPFGFLLGFLMATIPLPIYLTFALWVDRFEPEPSWLLVLAFVWGGAIAIFIALVFNTANTMLLGAVAGEKGITLGSILSAPLVEEIAKGAALLLLFLWQREEFDDVADGIVYATLVGLGFAMTENIQYYGRAITTAGGQPLVLFLIRGIIGPFCHPLFTSMTGIGLGIARETPRQWLRWVAPVAGLAVAIALHLVWNLSASLGPLFFVAYFLVMVPAFLAVVIVAIFSLRREAHIIRMHLRDLEASGLLTAEDLDVLTSVSRRITSCLSALLSGGTAAWLGRMRFHRVATDLAFHSWHRSQGEQIEDYTIERNLSIGEIRRMREALEITKRNLPPLRPSTMSRTIVAGTFGALVCTAGPHLGKRFDIGLGGFHIGRDPSAAQVVIRDGRVSKRHVWIGMRQGQVVMVDTGSLNGTYINDTAARVRRRSLRPGDTIIISADVARFRFES